MKKQKSILSLFVGIALVAMLFVGCTTIPEEYTEGVRLSSSYPEGDLPLYDDAVVYYCDDDDDNITIRYGVEADIDDVSDFYKDFFEENEITLQDETDKSTRYVAEGYYKDFEFEVRATPSSGEYEEKLYVTTVRIKIEFLDEDDIPGNEPALSAQIIGFWRQESIDKGSGKINTIEDGIGQEFTVDGLVSTYLNYEVIGTGIWKQSDNNTIEVIVQEESYFATATIEQQDGKDYLTWEDGEGTTVFYRESLDSFIQEGAARPEPDEDILSSFVDITWHGFADFSSSGDSQVCEPNTTIVFKSDNSIRLCNPDGSVIEGTWSLAGTSLLLSYDNENQSYSIITEMIKGINFLYLLSDNESYVYSDLPLLDDIVMLEEDFRIENAIIDSKWYSEEYLYYDDSKVDMTESTLQFYANGTFDETIDGNLEHGTWSLNDTELTLSYTDESRVFNAYIAFNAKTNEMVMLLDDREEKHLVYTTYGPMND